tara:strand:+ start:625 stop:3657 length:3033 start_codon:yes stop_codon:yes gene_type:complete
MIKFLQALLLLISFASLGQNVSGVVTAGGEGLPGVSVIIKGTTNGTSTDVDGRYSLSVSGVDNPVLVYTSVGFSTQEIEVGNRTVIDVALEEDEVQLGEVVVTALGIEREEKSLTYTQQTVGGDELTKVRDVNFLSNLAGRAAGVQIQKSSGGPGGSTKVQLRGNKNLTGDSDPLFVIDGIPMVNNKGGQPGMWGGVDGGDGISQLNQDDIESISILKGANAAALYGSQGANGVVLITTKKGQAGKAKITLNSGVTFENVLLKPDLQFKYGAIGGIKESWDTNPGNYDDNYVDDFFRTGVNFINSISISGGNDKTTAYFSYANTDATGIMPNNEYGRNNITFKQSTKLLNDKLTIRSSVMLAQEKTENRPAAGYYLNPLTGLYRFPRNGATPQHDPSLGLQGYEYFKNNPTFLNTDRNVEEMNWFVTDHHQSNPWFLLEGQPSVNETKRVISSLNLDYQFTENLSLAVRGNIDYADKLQETRYASGGNTTNIHPNGRWDYDKYQDQLTYVDAILKYNENFGDLSLGVIAGATYQKRVYGLGVSVGTGTNGLLYANEYYFQNLPDNVAVNSTLASRDVKQGLFFNTTLGYRDFVYLDFSGRTDWSSTLVGTGNENYFYPAVGLSAVISEMLNIPEPISFGKVRLSYSQVGQEIPWNQIVPSNSVDGSTGGVNRASVAPGTDLKPEIITTLELGTHWDFLDSRIGIDFTYYDITSTDEFFTVPALAGSIYNTRVINVGELNNKGIEIIVDGTPIYNNDFTWKTSINFSRNINTVVKGDPNNPDNFINTGSSEGYFARFKEGGSIGDLYTLSFVRDDQGRIVLGTNGAPRKTAANADSLNYRGNLNPDFILGWSNNLSYNNFSLAFMINGNFGGLAVSKTEAMLDEAGVSQRTADDRDQGFTAINAVSSEGNPVSQIDPELYYRTIGGRNGIMEPYVYSRTNVRLTQVALSYNTRISAIPVTFSIVGQNLMFFYIDAPFDPELAMSTNRNSPSLDNFNVPATRNFGFNIQVSF